MVYEVIIFTLLYFAPVIFLLVVFYQTPVERKCLFFVRSSGYYSNGIKKIGRKFRIHRRCVQIPALAAFLLIFMDYHNITNVFCSFRRRDRKGFES